VKKQPSWLRPVAIAIAAIVGCVAPANGFGFFLKRPDAVTPLAAMFLFIAGVFALMMRVAQPPKIAIEKTPHGLGRCFYRFRRDGCSRNASALGVRVRVDTMARLSSDACGFYASLQRASALNSKTTGR